MEAELPSGITGDSNPPFGHRHRNRYRDRTLIALGHERLDVYRLAIGKALEEAERQKRKTELDRMAAMLSRLGGRGYQVRESEEAYAAEGEGGDPDPDSDLDETKPE